MIPLGVPRHSRWGIVASLSVLFRLPATIAVKWYEWESRPLQKYELVRIKLRFLDHSQGLASLSDFQRNWKADRYRIRRQLVPQNGLFNWSRTSCHNWPIGVADPKQCRSQSHLY